MQKLIIDNPKRINYLANIARNNIHLYSPVKIKNLYPNDILAAISVIENMDLCIGSIYCSPSINLPYKESYWGYLEKPYNNYKHSIALTKEILIISDTICKCDIEKYLVNHLSLILIE